MNRLRKAEKINHSRPRQRGVVLVLFTIGMLMIIVMAGLALDISHALLNKSRLQNTVDAAALTAAKTLGQTSDTTQARAAAVTLFTNNAGTAGNGEMSADIDASEVVVEFSATLEPFNVGSSPAAYVRVRVENFTLGSWLIQLIGIDEKIVRSSAVSGPRTIDCGLVPMIVCGDPDAGAPLWGYEPEKISVLKGSSQSGSQAGSIGPGNFQLAAMGNPGANQLRRNLAGGATVCPVDGEVTSEPGNAVGPVAQGLNTRLDIYTGPISPGDYPPDVVVEQQGAPLNYNADTGTVTLRGQVVTDANDLDFNYADYKARVDSGNYDISPRSAGGIAEFERRSLPVPIADCGAGNNSGRSDLPVLGVACFFMLQQVRQNGSEAEVYGEFVETCRGSGNPGPDPQELSGPTKIQLYKDVDGRDS